MTAELRILILEDVPTDAELMERALRKAGLAFQAQRVDTRAGFEQALEAFQPDIVLADYKLPAFSGREALQIARRVHPEVPVIIVSGVLGDEAAIELVHEGAKDYVLKSNLVRLDHAIQRALATETGIRARKAAERAVRLTAHRLGEAERIGKLGFLDWNLSTNEIEVSDETLRIYGLAPGKNTLAFEEITQRVHPDDVGYAVDSLRNAIEKGTRHDIEHRIVRADGTVVYVHTPAEVVRDANGKPMSVLGTVQDITERKAQEAQISKLNRALRTLSDCNVALVHARSEEELFQTVCRHIVETGGYRMAFIGFAADDAAKTVSIAAQHGAEAGYLESLGFTWADTDKGQGTVGRALRSGAPQVSQNIMTDPQLAAWRVVAARLGIGASISLPLKGGDGKAFGVLTIGAAETDAFGAGEIELLTELADDTAFGMATLRTRAERNQAVKGERTQAVLLRQALEQTISAIALTVEKRDPYTAGHQQNVAEIAAAIGGEMGLPQAQVEGLRLGALIHDIGKVYVPAEILNRPGKLSELEFDLIKTHPQVGFDIVKDIPFPWPVAQMVLQHHERLDGSGYPQGLKGDEIILEGRILAVADVLEAMAAHRPYRAALGMDAGMKELARGRGTAYDAAVVDACLNLLRQQRLPPRDPPGHAAASALKGGIV